MKIYNHLLNIVSQKGGAYLILIDPDKLGEDTLPEFLHACEESDVDGLLIGGSLLFNVDLQGYIEKLRQHTSLPKIIFPGDVNQITNNADAILFLSLISGRNPDHLIGKHVLAAPIIKKVGIEPISTGYMLIDSGALTTAQYMSISTPIPRNKPEIAVATALAAQYLGMKMIYLEAGSGADDHVPFEMVKAVSSQLDIPVIAGGGIRTPEVAAKMVASGAQIVVTGNYFEDTTNWNLMKQFADGVHQKVSVRI